MYLEYLLSVFQIQRIRRQEDPEATKDLIDTSVQLLSAIVGMTRYYQHCDVKRNFGWIVSLCLPISDFQSHNIFCRIPKHRMKQLIFDMSSLELLAVQPPAFSSPKYAVIQSPTCLSHHQHLAQRSFVP